MIRRSRSSSAVRVAALAFWALFLTSWGGNPIAEIERKDIRSKAAEAVAMNAVADLKIQMGAVDVASAKTIALSALAVATPTEIASHANNWIHFELVLRNTGLTT